MNRIIFVFLLLIIILGSAHFNPTFAAKKRVRAVRQPGVIYSSAKLSRATNSVILSLYNLNQVNKISYVLSYSANGIPQGAMGSIATSGQTSDSRDLYFGTCSKGVCTPHYNITNANLTVTVNLNSGGSFIKRYRMKI